MDEDKGFDDYFLDIPDASQWPKSNLRTRVNLNEQIEISNLVENGEGIISEPHSEIPIEEQPNTSLNYKEQLDQNIVINSDQNDKNNIDEMIVHDISSENDEPENGSEKNSESEPEMEIDNGSENENESYGKSDSEPEIEIDNGSENEIDKSESNNDSFNKSNIKENENTSESFSDDQNEVSEDISYLERKRKPFTQDIEENFEDKLNTKDIIVSVDDTIKLKFHVPQEQTIVHEILETTTVDNKIVQETQIIETEISTFTQNYFESVKENIISVSKEIEIVSEDKDEVMLEADENFDEENDESDSDIEIVDENDNDERIIDEQKNIDENFVDENEQLNNEDEIEVIEGQNIEQEALRIKDNPIQYTPSESSSITETVDYESLIKDKLNIVTELTQGKYKNDESFQVDSPTTTATIMPNSPPHIFDVVTPMTNLVPTEKERESLFEQAIHKININVISSESESADYISASESKSISTNSKKENNIEFIEESISGSYHSSQDDENSLNNSLEGSGEGDNSSYGEYESVGETATEESEESSILQGTRLFEKTPSPKNIGNRLHFAFQSLEDDYNNKNTLNYNESNKITSLPPRKRFFYAEQKSKLDVSSEESWEKTEINGFINDQNKQNIERWSEEDEEIIDANDIGQVINDEESQSQYSDEESIETEESYSSKSQQSLEINHKATNEIFGFPSYIPNSQPNIPLQHSYPQNTIRSQNTIRQPISFAQTTYIQQTQTFRAAPHPVSKPVAPAQPISLLSSSDDEEESTQRNIIKIESTPQSRINHTPTIFKERFPEDVVLLRERFKPRDTPFSQKIRNQISENIEERVENKLNAITTKEIDTIIFPKFAQEESFQKINPFKNTITSQIQKKLNLKSFQPKVSVFEKLGKKSNYQTNESLPQQSSQYISKQLVSIPHSNPFSRFPFSSSFEQDSNRDSSLNKYNSLLGKRSLPFAIQKVQKKRTIENEYSYSVPYSYITENPLFH